MWQFSTAINLPFKIWFVQAIKKGDLGDGLWNWVYHVHRDNTDKSLDGMGQQMFKQALCLSCTVTCQSDRHMLKSFQVEQAALNSAVTERKDKIRSRAVHRCTTGGAVLSHSSGRCWEQTNSSKHTSLLDDVVHYTNCTVVTGGLSTNDQCFKSFHIEELLLQECGAVAEMEDNINLE